MKVKGLKAVFLLAALLLPLTVVAEPTDSFSKAKKLMMEKVYFDHRETLYCGAMFDEKGYPDYLVGMRDRKVAGKLNPQRINWLTSGSVHSFAR